MQHAKSLIRPALAAAFFAMSAGAANAMPDAMTTGGLTTQPVGHYEFCRRAPDECRPEAAGGAPVELTRRLWKTLIDVNNAVNLAVEPRTDQEMWGVDEYWSYPGAAGDCEDYVLEKRRRLIESGVPANSLLITVVRQPNGDGHAVLTVSTSMGDYVLDNVEPRILVWTETEYTYLKRQAAGDPGKWVSISDGGATAVGSLAGNR